MKEPSTSVCDVVWQFIAVKGKDYEGWVESNSI